MIIIVGTFIKWLREFLKTLSRIAEANEDITVVPMGD